MFHSFSFNVLAGHYLIAGACFFSWIRQYECQTWEDSKTRLHKRWGSIMLHLFLPALVASIWLKVAQGICVLWFWGNHVVVVPLQPICRGSYMRCLSAWVGSTSYTLLSLSLARSLLQCLGWWVDNQTLFFFSPIWGNDQIWQIFFKWDETNN